MHCFAYTIFQLIYRKTGTDNPTQGLTCNKDLLRIFHQVDNYLLKVVWLVGIVWRSLQTCLFHRAERLVHNSWQSQHILSANCWRVLLMELLSLGIEVNVGRGEGMGRQRGCMFVKEDWGWQENALFSEPWRWCHILSSWKCFFYQEASWLERSASLEQGCLIQCHA